MALYIALKANGARSKAGAGSAHSYPELQW
jgi:hypothetical protein